jgi:hypothetical protein
MPYGNIHDVRSGLHIGMKIGLINAFEGAGKAAPGFTFIRHSRENYAEKLMEASRLLDDHTCLIVANTKEFQGYIKRNLDQAEVLLKGRKLVILTSQFEYHNLDELAGRIDFFVQVYPYERIGRAVVHKLNNRLDAKFEDTTTLVNGVFEKFNLNSQ